MIRLFYKIKIFFNSLFWHISRGAPKSTQETILYRLELCKSCDNFDKHNSQCLICGCNISDKKIFLNKLAWSDQECPIGKWGSTYDKNNN